MNYHEKQLENTNRAYQNEKQVIYKMSMSKDNSLIMAQQLRKEWFLTGETRNLFSIIKKARLSDDDIHKEISKHKLSTLYAECMSYDYVTSNVDNLVKGQKEYWLKSKINHLIQKHSEKEIKSPVDTISEIWSELLDLSNGQEFEKTDMSYIIKLFEDEKEEYTKKKAEGRKYIGYETGITSIDENIDGLRDGHLHIYGGYTSAGKTQFCLNVVNSLIKQGVKTSVYSLEMSKVDILKRMLGIITGHNGSLLLKTDEGLLIRKKDEALKVLKDSDLRVHTEKFALDEILTSMIIEKQTQGVKVFILDYAQLVKAGGQGLYEDMRSLAIRLQNFCVTYKIPVILISQVSNESAKGGNSNMIGFKGAGDLGASADLAIELKSAEENDERERKVANNEAVAITIQAKKNRHGKIFNDEIYFQPQTGQFFNENPSLKDF